jgi:ketosteroid isomerase-like protein
MPASSPGELDLLIAKAISSGDADAAMSLYEDDAAFIPPGASASEPVRGKDALRQVLSEFLTLSPTLTTEPKKVIEVGDIALVTGDWTLTGKGPDGDVRMSGTFADVMRRQPDGTWLFVLDNPDGVA